MAGAGRSAAGAETVGLAVASGSGTASRSASASTAGACTASTVTATLGGTGRWSIARSGVGALGSGATAGSGVSCGVGGAEDSSTSGRGTVASVIAVVGTGVVRSAVMVGGVGVTAICAAGVSGSASDAGGGIGAVPSTCALRTGSGWNRGGTTCGLGVSSARSGGACVGTGTLARSGWGGGALGWVRGRCATAATLGGGALGFTSGFTRGGGATGTAMAGGVLVADATALACDPLDARLAFECGVFQRVFATGAFDGVPRTGGTGGGGLSMSRTSSAFSSGGDGGGGRMS